MFTLAEENYLKNIFHLQQLSPQGVSTNAIAGSNEQIYKYAVPANVVAKAWTTVIQNTKALPLLKTEGKLQQILLESIVFGRFFWLKN